MAPSSEHSQAPPDLTPPPSLTVEDVKRLSGELAVDQFHITVLPCSVMEKVKDRRIRRAMAEKIVSYVFDKLNLDPKRYKAAYNDSVTKVINTSIYKKDVFSGWGGHKDLGEKLKRIEALIADDIKKAQVAGVPLEELAYMVDAPVLVTAYAVKNLRCVKSSGTDYVTKKIEEWNLFNYLPIAIKAHHKFEWEGQATGGIFRIVHITGQAIVKTSKRDGDWTVCIDLNSYNHSPLAKVDTIRRVHHALDGSSPPVDEVEATRVIKVTRERVMAEIQDTIPKLEDPQEMESIQEDFKSWLTVPKFKVLPKEAKDKVVIWCQMYHKDFSITPDDLTQDLEFYSYEETFLIPNPELLSMIDIEKTVPEGLKAAGRAMQTSTDEDTKKYGRDLITYGYLVSATLIKAYERCRVKESRLDREMLRVQHREEQVGKQEESLANERQLVEQKVELLKERETQLEKQSESLTQQLINANTLADKDRSAQQEKINALNRAIESVEDANSEVTASGRTLRQSIADLRTHDEEHQRTVAGLEDEHQQRLADLDREHEQKVADQDDKHQRQMTDLDGSLKSVDSLRYNMEKFMRKSKKRRTADGSRVDLVEEFKNIIQNSQDVATHDSVLRLAEVILPDGHAGSFSTWYTRYMNETPAPESEAE